MRRVAACLAALIISLPASAHTPDEYQEWSDSWDARAAGGVTVGLVDEYRGMVARHAPTDSGASSSEGWESLIQIYFEPDDWEWARDVISCESNNDPDAYNASSGASGIWQFIPDTWSWSKPWPDASPFDPTAAFIAARWLRDNLGRSQWHCTALMGY